MNRKLLTILAAATLAGLSAMAYTIDWAKIRYWSGEGDNRAALVVQLDVPESDNPGAIVWGYRWKDGEKPTGEDMLRAVAAASPDLVALTQYTGDMGNTMCGIGYAADAAAMLDKIEYNLDEATEHAYPNTGANISFGFFEPNATMHQTSAPGNETLNLIYASLEDAAKTHIIEHPLNADAFGYACYDYDWWQMSSAKNCYWNAGWYKGYWSYWVGNASLDDLSYSGLGMSSTDLADGDVHAWKYNNIDGSTGATSGWLAPNYDHFADIDIEVSEPLKNALGHGNSMATLTLHWGDEVALDNLTEGVRFGNEVTAGDVIATALREDPRFYALKNAQGVYVAFGFDTNGDNSAAVSITGTSLDLVDGVAVADGEYADATASSAYDHWNISDENNCWKVFVNGALADFTTTVSNSDVVSLEYLATEATTPAEKTYTFYLRPADRIGIWLPEEVIINTADGKSVTVPAIATIANEKANLYGAYLGIDVFAEDGINTSNAYRASFSYRDTDKMSCTINVSTPANAILRPYLNIRKDWGTGKAEVKRVYPDTDTKVSTIVAKPLTGISLDGIEPGGVIEVDNMGVYILKPVYEPADADFTGYNATFANEEIATLYKSVNSVVAHAAGETTLTISSTDGSISSTYTVRVKDVDPGNRPENFTDGMVWLNEEWFGHTSGSLNYIDANGDLYTRAYGNQNGNMAFGATSQYGTVYAGKYIIISKQPWDGGDTRPLRSGGRVVVFDAETFEHLGAIDEIGGDGRSCVGVSPSKVYLGTSKGIRVMNLDDITVADADITGIAMGRSGQIGNMVKAGKYVFATNIGTGLSIIDTTDDSFVKTIPSTGIQGVVQSADGRVWIACSNTLTPVDPLTLETGTTYNIPGSITCSTYSWRSVNILAAHNSNTLIWGTGTFYRWNLDEVEDPSTLSPVYTHTAKVDNVNYGNGYGAPGYDEATDTYMYATLPGFGAAALQNWYHFVNASTGEMKARIHLPEYWWFPAMPINPDKHAPEILMEDITLDVGQEAVEYDLSELVNDTDNHNCNISVSLVAEPAAAAEEDVNLPVAETSIEGNRLTVTPNKVGEHSFTLMAESNGRTTTKTINVTVKDLSGISSAETVATGICKVYDTAGIEVATFRGTAADADTLGLPAGIYLVTTPDGSTTKVVIK